jgi:hypothetical protein
MEHMYYSPYQLVKAIPDWETHRMGSHTMWGHQNYHRIFWLGSNRTWGQPTKSNSIEILVSDNSCSHHPDIKSLYFYLNKCHFVQASFINFVNLIVGYRNLQVYIIFYNSDYANNLKVVSRSESSSKSKSIRAVHHLVISEPNVVIHNGEDKHMIMKRFCLSMIFWSSKNLQVHQCAMS